MTHPTNRLSDAVHQRVRLGVLVILEGASRADFRYLRDTLGLTDGNLGRHLEVLEGAGLVAVEKLVDRGRSRTWVRMTRAGRVALRAEVAALREIVASTDAPAIKRGDLALHAENPGES